MAIRIRHIATRFALILALAAAVPLVAYGVASIRSLQQGTHDSIIAGNLNVATRAADEIRRYVATNAALLKAVAADLQNTGLQAWQQDRILKNDVLQFRELREITLFDEAGAVVATSRAGKPRVAVPAGNAPAILDSVQMSPIHVDQDLLPTAVFAIHLTRLNQPDGWLIGEFSLEEMWKMVDQIRIGSDGFALVVGPDGTLIAHGDPDKKALIAQSRNLSGHPLVGRAAAQSGPLSTEYMDEDGRAQLAVAARIAPLNWTVIVEQPTRDAYASAQKLQRQLIVAIAIALLIMIALGLFFGRRFIAPIFALQRGTQAVAEGHLEARVAIDTEDEFGKLGDAFNTMAARLGELQENLKRQERQAMFARVARGLVHDLNHPLQRIGPAAQVLSREGLDPEERRSFAGIVQQNLGYITRFMNDILNMASPQPVEHVPVDVNMSLTEIVDSVRIQAKETNIVVEARCAKEPLIIEGDRFALNRVYGNLIRNAIQAMPSGGRLTVTTARADDRIEISVADTGAGIPADRIGAIFDEFVSTKKDGIGIGLTVSKRIVEELHGTITVDSEVGRGTSFTLRFPARDGHSSHAAAS